MLSHPVRRGLFMQHPVWPDWRRRRYAALVTMFDTHAGQLVAAMRAAGHWDNGLVIMSSGVRSARRHVTSYLSPSAIAGRPGAHHAGRSRRGRAVSGILYKLVGADMRDCGAGWLQTTGGRST